MCVFSVSVCMFSASLVTVGHLFVLDAICDDLPPETVMLIYIAASDYFLCSILHHEM
jgi:hypothetical protein